MPCQFCLAASHVFCQQALIDGECTTPAELVGAKASVRLAHSAANVLAFGACRNSRFRTLHQAGATALADSSRLQKASSQFRTSLR